MASARIREHSAGVSTPFFEFPQPSLPTNIERNDPSTERRLLFKVDSHVVPILFMLLYSLAAFIDRINIGNVKLEGLEADLHMDPSGHQFNIALFVFFMPYILLEVPCNIILRKLRPSVWLSSIMLGWGIITICQGCVHSFAALVACRFLLGVFEAGFFPGFEGWPLNLSQLKILPGSVYLISMYYRRHELQRRISVFFCASVLAGAFSGLLAYALAKLDGIGGIGGWRWIFIIEGLATVVLAFASFWLVPDWPADARFLDEEERAMLLRRLAEDTAGVEMDCWTRESLGRVFGDSKIWLGVLMYLGIVTTAYATSFFTPTILHQLGPSWTVVRSQLMTIPIYVTATIITITTAVLSDRFKHRFSFIMIGCCTATIGYAMLLNMDHFGTNARYAALFFVIGGAFMAQPLVLVWLSNNMGGHIKRGMSSALQIGLGNCGGIIASNIFVQKQKPHYPLGFGLSLALIWLCAFSAVTFLVFLCVENKKRDRNHRDDRFNLSQDDLNNLGDDHPSFRFTY